MKKGVIIVLVLILNISLVTASPLFAEDWNKWLSGDSIFKYSFTQKGPTDHVKSILLNYMSCSSNEDCKSYTLQNGTTHLCSADTKKCEPAFCGRVRDCTKFMEDSPANEWFCRGSPGQCIASFCKETDPLDGEAQYYHKGEIQYENNPKLLAEQDFCIDDYTLFEKKCNSPSDPEKNTERHFCEGGCKDGACQPFIKSEKGTCIDIGGGINYFKKGELLFYPKQDFSLHPRIEPEYCEDNTTLVEKYCTKEGEIGSQNYQCESGCKDGACILPPLKVTQFIPAKIPVYFVQDYDTTLVVDGAVRLSTISNRFLVNHPDNNDFLIIFNADYPNIKIPHTSLFTRVRENPAKGLGRIDNEKVDPKIFGSSEKGKLQGVVYIISNFGLFQTYPEEYGYRPLLEEITHNWAVGIQELSGIDSVDTYHWSRGLQSLWEYDGMRGARPWKDNSDGSFSLPNDPCNIADHVYSFSPFTLYLMGLADPKEVTQNFLFIESPELRNDPCKKTIHGAAKKININDIIRFAGKQRTITSEASQKDFKVTFLVVYPKDSVLEQYAQNRFAWLADNFPKKWQKATSCRSTINSIKIPPAECASTIYPKR
ncbi:hypothetical protein HZB00_01530 [Candidatus Woesearchaeota archaeon]|nr:hypothetical protein [Candidatus Woesearchaeota archaeon]